MPVTYNRPPNTGTGSWLRPINYGLDAHRFRPVNDNINHDNRRQQQDYDRIMEAMADMNRRIRKLERELQIRDARIAKLENQVASFHQALETWDDQS